MAFTKVTEIIKTSPVFTQLTDLAAERLGGKVLYSTDDFFAEKENLIKPGRGIFITDKYTDRGKWMDGWESRRKRTPGHDWAVIQLATPGKITGFDIDTNFFLGNHPPHASIEAVYLNDGAPVKDWDSDAIEWDEVLAKSHLDAGSQNFYECNSDEIFTHIRLHIYPDGGVARLRVYGEVFKNWDAVGEDETIDLLAAINGGKALACNDMFFSAMGNLTMPNRGINMGDGWETKRNRTPGNRDWVILKLATAGNIEKIIVDTCHFKGNYPDTCSIEACISYDDAAVVNNETTWQTILPQQKLSADKEHEFIKEIEKKETYTHVRLNIFPDGGISRLRLFGKEEKEIKYMLPVILLIVLSAILLMLVIMTYYLRTVKANYDEADEAGEQGAEEKKEGMSASQTFVYTSIILVSVSLVIVVYLMLRGTIWEGHLMEWMNIIVRLMHITFGIAWIGASFYFVFLENALNRTKDVRDELAGNLWAIHGGGFYYLEKYKVAPQKIPKHLHWFKYEAYFTWISGFCLLFVVYYFNASAMLIDKNILDISPLMGIGIGVGSFIVAWVIYDLLCKSPLIKKNIWFTLIGFVISIGFAYFYSRVFNSRAAYMHFGAMLGSIMVANVFYVIIPAQKAMVKAAREGKPLDAQLGKNAGMRSLHNNYFTLPVLFVMISNHFPSTFGNEYSWLVLAIMTLGVAGVKHYLNLKEKGQISVWVMPVSVLILLGAAFMTAPEKPGACKSEVSFAEVNAIIQQRCVSCHSAKPTDEVYSAAPNGVMYDLPLDIVKYKDKIMQRVVITKTMPQNNKTNITQKERDLIRCWIEQGASVK